MAIEYKDIKNFSPKVLQDLFFSVDWESGQYPEKLAAAMQHSDAVYSAWDGEKLVGLMNAITDHAMTADFHDLLVRPEYQGQHVGSELVKRMVAHYWDIPCKLLLCDGQGKEFYKKCGFDDGKDLQAVYISDLY